MIIGEKVKISEDKQRELYFDLVDQYLTGLGFNGCYLPEPENTIFTNLSKNPSIVDTWLGSLHFNISHAQEYRVELLIQIVDWNFLSLPKVYIKGPLPKELEQLIGLAHFLPAPYYIFIDGFPDYYLNICYSIHSEISLPRHNPKELLRWVLDQCRKLFEDSLIRTSIRDADIKRDLDVMWQQLSAIILGSEIDFSIARNDDITLLVDKIEEQAKNGGDIDLDLQEDKELLQRFRSLSVGSQFYIHRIEPFHTEKILFKKNVQWQCRTDNSVGYYLTRFFVMNTIGSENQLPSLDVFSKRIFNYQKELHSNRNTIHKKNEPLLRLVDLIFWLKTWNKATLSIWKDIFYDLFKSEEVWNYKELYFCLIVDGTPLAFCIIFPDKIEKFTTYKALSNEINSLKILNDLEFFDSTKLLSKIGIVPLLSKNLTASFIFNRNLEGMQQDNLSARVIVVIGVGAVGGYLAHSLARLGAGSENGELILIDADSLSASNIGRHVLGGNYISISKVSALKKQLELELPRLDIKDFNMSIEELLSSEKKGFDLSQADIIFDATAKAGVGELLSEWRHQLEFPQPCLIHVWIRDNGECVQCLLNEPSNDVKSKFACRSCLQIAGGKFLPEYDALPNHEPKIAYAACSDFTPYAVSASMSAAALAIDMVLDYVNDINSPRYRTRYTERWTGPKIESTDALVASDCPYCSGMTYE